MGMTRLEYLDHVAVLKLDRGVTNAFNLDLVRTLEGHLRDLARDNRVRGLVLSSANDKFFSIGFDLPGLIPLEAGAFREFYHAFNRVCLDLYTFPKPTVAAITGHAVAGGCILALFCDYRFIAMGKKLMGLNEIQLGVPVPYPADCALRSIVGERNTREITDTGTFYPPDLLLAMGLVDKVLPLEEVRAAAMDKAASLGAHPASAFLQIKRNRTELMESRIRERLEEKEDAFIACWFSPEARMRLDDALKNFQGKKRAGD